MILSFRDKNTRRFHSGQRVKAFEGFDRIARLKMDRLEAATELADLVAVPGNRFEVLRGNREGQFSIRINDQWRLCFTWDEAAHAITNVEIVDCH